MLGRSLKELEKGPWFGRFALRRQADGSYVPEGHRLAPFVRLQVDTGAGSTVTRVCLHLSRRLVEHPVLSAFAREIVEALLQAALGQDGLEPVADLMRLEGWAAAERDLGHLQLVAWGPEGGEVGLRLTLAARPCPACRMPCEPAAKYCPSCGKALEKRPFWRRGR